MRLGFLSDLHLGPRKTSRCTSTPAELLATLDLLEHTCDRVICVGDMYDLLRPRSPRGWRAELEHVRQDFPELHARLGTLTQVVGNHDRPLIVHGVPEELTVVTPRQRLLVMHGHQWDVWLKKLWGMEESANFVAGWLERTGLDAVSTWMGDVSGRVQALGARGESPPQGSSDEEHAYWKGMAAELDRGFDVIVAGHTHGLELREMPDGKLAINTGSHAHGWRDAAVLDLGEGWALTWRDDVIRQAATFCDREKVWRVGDEASVHARWQALIA